MLSTMLVKRSVLGLQNPVTPDDEKWRGLQRTRMELIREMTVESEFLTTDHLQAVKEEISEGKKPRDNINTDKLEGIIK